MPEDVHRCQERWRAARSFLNSRRHPLSLAAQHVYPQSLTVAGTPLLSRPGWMADRPVPLEQVSLSWQDPAPPAAVTGADLASGLPLRQDATRFASYAEALGELRRPGIFEDRFCYRLLDAQTAAGGADLRFGPGQYFDLVSTCEAVAHEYAAAWLARNGGSGAVSGAAAPAAALAAGPAVAGGSSPALTDLPLRALIGDPTDLQRRPVMTATCTLLLRAGRRPGEASMLLHWRDPARVASGGGLYQVVPVGMFQPSHDAGWNRANDFDLWRSITRELSEELLGGAEDYHSDSAPIDYGSWPLYAQLAEARAAGTVRVYWLGIGADPLSLAVDMLTVAVFDAGVFDTIFSGLVATNAEGHLVTGADAAGVSAGMAFSAANIERFTTREPMQAAGAALLRTAWAHRSLLLG